MKILCEILSRPIIVYLVRQLPLLVRAAVKRTGLMNGKLDGACGLYAQKEKIKFF
uniref:Beta-amylase 2ic isoform X1 n=1 Tax=Rhizophora mucronata TaxID=61149 RepID=A0A2P2JUP5_RHIMU